ncbi:MAG: iron hydrogenase small subunit [Planctomycetota bacterium]|nr:iron hydrogenase small subunit [Planctomycetota bacterium]
MACPGGCIGGAGQPVSPGANVRAGRAAGLYEADRSLQLRKSQDNPLLAECYQKHLGEVGGHKAHELLHTGFHSRRRIFGESVVVESRQDRAKLDVAICVGTSCHVRGSHTLLRQLGAWLQEEGLGGAVEVTATFCMERCGQAPNVMVADTLISGATLETITAAILAHLSALAPAAGA